MNYDETIALKIVGNADPKRIGWDTGYATDNKFPDPRTGKIAYMAFAWHFGVWMPKDSLEASVEADGKILGTPKPLIDLAIYNPRPKLDDVMPLAAAGQEFVDALGDRYSLYLNPYGARRYLLDVRLGPGGEWLDDWLFLVLQELRRSGA